MAGLFMEVVSFWGVRFNGGVSLGVVFCSGVFILSDMSLMMVIRAQRSWRLVFVLSLGGWGMGFYW